PFLTVAGRKCPLPVRAGYARKGVCSAAEEIAEAERSVEQCPDRQQCPLVHPVAFAGLLDMARHGLLADAENARDFPISLAARDPQHAVSLPIGQLRRFLVALAAAGPQPAASPERETPGKLADRQQCALG